MRPRAWIGILATMGVLLHAHFLVRHGLTMADAGRQYRALLADLTSLCRPGSGKTSTPVSDLPHAPPPDDSADCPVCAGLVGAFMLASPQPAVLLAPAAALARLFHADVAEARPLRVAHPPARGPPAHA
jgi:DUF2946 family protein